MSYPRGVSPSFKARANEAAYWEAWVGAVLARAGLFTLHHPFKADGQENHALSWDLDVSAKSPDLLGTEKVLVEVKSLNLTFNRPDDYPFPTVLVCSHNSWERKWPGSEKTMRDFLLVSRATGAIIWIPIGSPVKTVTITDTTRKETYKAKQTKIHYLMDLIDFVEYVNDKGS